MDSETYWAKRAEEREAYWYKKCQDTIDKELAAYYMDSLGRIQTDIAALYGRFAKDNQLSATEARKLLKGNEYRQWRMSIDQYVKKIRETGDKGLERELNVLAMRSRISRLDKLYGETLMELQSLGEKVTTSMKAFLSEAYKDNYYHGVYDIAKAGQLRNAVSKVDTKALEDVLRYRWSGMNYSERIWKNQRFLAYNLRKEMVAAVHHGESVEKISSRIAKRMNVGISNASRLVRTELNYVHNHAALDSIADSGMKYFRFIATLDRRTSAICREHDGHIYPVEEAAQGTNVPPLHPNCRSTIAGSLRGEDSTKTGMRAARNEQGKTIFVPASMKYEDWKAVYVDKSQNLTDWLKENITPKPQKPITDLIPNYKKRPPGWRRKFMRQTASNKPSSVENTVIVKEFQPAKSSQDVMAYMNQFVYDNVSLDGRFHLPVLNGISEAIYNVSTRYNRKLRIKSIARIRADERKYREGGYNPQTQQVTLKNLSLNQYKQKAEKNFAIHWNASKDTYGTFYHEIGHAVWEDLPKNAVDEITNLYKKLKQQAYEKWMEQGGSRARIHQEDIFGQYLSRYAITNEKEFFSESFSQIMSKRMRPVSREVSKILDKYYKHQVIQTGGRTAEQYINGEIEASKYYENMRNREDDVSKIAQNTGFSKRFINEVKQHIFLDSHTLDKGRGYFDVDYNIAVAWQRLINNKYEKRDILLLRHEHLERAFEIRYNLKYRDAHNIANQKYEWDAAIKQLFGKDGDMENDSLSELIKQEPK